MSLLSAMLSYKLIKNHVFANGNKRTALLAVNLFMLHNGKHPRDNPFGTDSELSEAYYKVAEGQMSEEDLASVHRYMWRDVKEEKRTITSTTTKDGPREASE